MTDIAEIIAMTFNELSGYIKIFYIVPSIITFIVYAVDKSAAKNGRWRVKERTLHLLSLVGGWPGAILAQKIFRHKTHKQPFRFIFFTMVLLNLLVFYAMYQLNIVMLIRTL